MFEGNRGPGILSSGALGLTISSNYFEANNGENNGSGESAPMLMHPNPNSTTAPTLTVRSDIVLNGWYSCP